MLRDADNCDPVLNSKPFMFLRVHAICRKLHQISPQVFSVQASAWLGAMALAVNKTESAQSGPERLGFEPVSQFLCQRRCAKRERTPSRCFSLGSARAL